MSYAAVLAGPASKDDDTDVKDVTVSTDLEDKTESVEAGIEEAPAVETPVTLRTAWNRGLLSRAVHFILEYASTHDCIITGYASVMSLNPAGMPPHVRSAALVAPEHADVLAVVYDLASYVTTCLGCDPAVQDLILDEKPFAIAMHGDIYIVKAGEDQIATMTAYPSDLETSAVWKQPINHASTSWSLLQFLPHVLRAQLVARNAQRLVRQLDGWISERALCGMEIGIEMKVQEYISKYKDHEPVAPVHHPRITTPWTVAEAWAGILITLDHVPSIHAVGMPFELDVSRLNAGHLLAKASWTETGCQPLQAFMALPPLEKREFLLLPYLGMPHDRLLLA